MAKITSKTDSINVSIFKALKISEKSRIPLLILSNPGLGKTTTVELFSEVRGYRTQLLRGNSTTAEEVLGYDVASGIEKGEKTTQHLRPSWYTRVLENDKQGIPTLLFLDEITTANEYVQSALLHLVFERMVGDEPLPDSTLIVSAGNYSQNLSSQMNLLPPLMNRFMILNITPNVNDLDTFLNKFQGAVVSGKKNDYFSDLKDLMVELDKEAPTVSSEIEAKIGQYIEDVIKTQTRLLITKEKKVDLGEVNLQGIYTEMQDNRVYGFISFRTLNYLREMALASYLCFGEAGLRGNTFGELVYGLCGIGVTRPNAKSEDVEINNVGNIYIKAIQNVLFDIRRLSDTVSQKYESKIEEILSHGISDAEGMSALNNKLKELLLDEEINKKFSESPLQKSVIANVANKISQGCNTRNGKLVGNTKSSSSQEDFFNKFPISNFGEQVNYWNILTEVIGNIHSILSRGYEPEFIKDITKNWTEDKTSVTNLVRTLKAIFLKYRVVLADPSNSGKAQEHSNSLKVIPTINRIPEYRK